MNNFKIPCGSNVKNTGLSKLCADIGTIAGYIVCPYNYAFSKTEQESLEATLKADIQAPKPDRIYPFTAVFLMEDNSEETVYQEGSISNLFVRDGKINLTFTHGSSRYKHAALKSHSNKKVSVILFDQQGRLQMVSEDGETAEAQNIETFTVENLMINDGTNATTTKVTMIFADSFKWQLYPAVIIPDFDVKSLEGLFDVALSTQGTPSGSEVIILAECYGTADGVVGLSDTPGDDWSVKDNAGIEVPPTTITDNGDGTYTFAFGTPITGAHTFDLLPSYSMATSGYESLGGVIVTP